MLGLRSGTGAEPRAEDHRHNDEAGNIDAAHLPGLSWFPGRVDRYRHIVARAALAAIAASARFHPLAAGIPRRLLARCHQLCTVVLDSGRSTSGLPASVPLACQIGGSITVPSGQSRSLRSDR
jgi:hypothetical protein